MVSSYISKTFIKILVMLLVVTLFFYAMTIGINAAFQKRTRDEYIGNIEVKMEFYLSMVEREIDGIRNSLQLYIDDLEIRTLSLSTASMSLYDKLGLIRNIRSKLALQTNSSRYVRFSEVDIPGIGFSVGLYDNTAESIKKDRYYDLLDQMLDTGKTPMFYRYEDAIYMLSGYPVSWSSPESVLHLLRYTLDENQMRQDLELFFWDSPYSAAFHFREIDWAIYSSRSEVRQLHEQSGGPKTGDRISDEDGRDFYVIKLSSETLMADLYVYLPMEALHTENTLYTTIILILTGITFFIIILFYRLANKVLGIPMRTLTHAFDQVKTGNTGFRIRQQGGEDFDYMYDSFNSMMEETEQLNRRITEQETSVLKAELRQLQYQIRPHFLYNSLYLIYRLAIAGDLDGVRELAQHLGGYYRYITKKSAEMVSLKEEIEHAKSYVEIQKIRFKDRIDVQFSALPEQYESILVPVMLLQPILENAYGHALEEGEGGGILRVTIEPDEDGLLFTVDDNGPGMPRDKMMELVEKMMSDEIDVAESSGIVNVSKRLQYHYGKRYIMRFGSNEMGGIRVQFVIPLPDSPENPPADQASR